MAQGSPAEMVGATDAPITLQSGSPMTARFAGVVPTGPGRRAHGAGAAHQRVFLNLENITSEGVAPTYAVYLNLPEGANPDDHDELLAGLLPSFGVHEASRRNAQHAGSGLRHALDVTRI